MAAVITAAQFGVSCLVLGLGLFLLAGAVKDLHQSRLLAAGAARAMTALGGALLVAAGAYAARLAVPV